MELDYKVKMQKLDAGIKKNTWEMSDDDVIESILDLDSNGYWGNLSEGILAEIINFALCHEINVYDIKVTKGQITTSPSRK